MDIHTPSPQSSSLNNTPFYPNTMYLWGSLNVSSEKTCMATVLDRHIRRIIGSVLPFSTQWWAATLKDTSKKHPNSHPTSTSYDR